MRLTIKRPAGIAPAIAATELPDNFAQIAHNCRLHGADLRAWRAPADIWTPTKAGTINGIYRFGQDAPAETDYWFHWNSDVDVVRGPIFGDTTERTYFTGDGVPKVTNALLALSGGGTNYPIAAYTLGVPAPTLAPNLVVSGSATGDSEDRVYVYTYVTGWGEEGPPSPPSTITQVYPSQSVDLSGMLIAPAGNYNITHKRIYRTGGSSGEYLFVTEVPVASATYLDNLPTSELNEAMSSTEYNPPPETMSGLVSLGNGILAGFDGIDVYFCVPYRPHAWPARYAQSVDSPIVGLGVFGQTLVVLTQSIPYLVVGVDPSAMQMTPLNDFPQACVSKQSIVSMEGGVFFASPDGLCNIGSGGFRIATVGRFDHDAWQAYKPSTIRAWAHDGRYIGFYDTGTVQQGFVFDPADAVAPFVTIGFHATAGYRDIKRDALYLMTGGKIKKWDAGAAMANQWRSKRFVVGRSANPVWLRVLSSAWPVTINFYVDGALKHSRAFTSDEARRMPALSRNMRYWEIEVVGAGVSEVRIADSVDGLNG